MLPDPMVPIPHLPSEAQWDPQGSLGHCPLQECSLSGVSPTPALTPAPHRTSLAEGEGDGRVDASHGGGEADRQSQGFWGQEGQYVCANVCESVCVRVYMSSLGLLFPVYVCMFL